jgi:hypothetical protein
MLKKLKSLDPAIQKAISELWRKDKAGLLRGKPKQLAELFESSEILPAVYRLGWVAGLHHQALNRREES